MTEEEKTKLHALLVEMLGNVYSNLTFEAICEQTGHSSSTLYRYRQDNKDSLQRDIDRRLKESLKLMRAEAYKSLLNRIKKSDNALKLFFQLNGELVERTESRVEYLTPEQKQEKIKQLLEKIQGTSHKDEATG